MPVIVLTIEELVAGGEGLAHHEGRAVFVAGGVPGDRVEAELVSERPLRARIVRVLEPSRERRDPECAHLPGCGGCGWLHVSLEAQREAKTRLLRDALHRIGGFAPQTFRLNPILTAEPAWAYRTRARLHVSGGKLGFLEAASHELVDVVQCRLLEPRLQELLARLREASAREGLPGKCTDVALAAGEKRVALAFFVARASPPVREKLARLARRAGADGAVIVPEEGAPVLEGKAVLASPAPLAPGVTLYGRPDLFAQAHPAGNQKLVGEALRMVGQGTAPSVLELFCGAGNFTFALAAGGRRVTAVELSGPALELARRSAREARIDTVRFVAGDSLEVADGLAREGQSFDVLLLDPPRGGAKGIGPLASRLGVSRVVYVSCDPATLARDLKARAAEGFHLVEATPVDMFPQTCHLESVALMERA